MSNTDETNADKFTRLKDTRLGKVMDAIRILKNVTNKRDYDYTDDQAQEVVDTIYDDVDELSEAFGIAPRSSGEMRTTPEAPTVEVDAASDASLAGDVSSAGDADVNDPTNMDPYGVLSSITEIDGKKLRVAPGDWDDLMLIRVGPRIGLAYEAALDGDSEKAAELLKKVMIS